MNKFNPHNLILANFFDSSVSCADKEQLEQLVNLDSADAILRSFLSIEEMKEFGSFFTGQELTTLAVNSFETPITASSIVLDPTCGTGNLLIECSRRLKIEKTLSETLTTWGKCLRGYDIHESFVEASKLRLILEAINRGATKNCSIDEARLLLPEIKVLDAMCVTKSDLLGVTHILMNPPFSSWDSPKIDYWKPGKVNAAGVVFDHYLRTLPENCVISAILPDVLRSGTRYACWREFVASNVKGKIFIAGKFNKKTDIDVFIIHGCLKSETSNSITWFQESTNNNIAVVSDYFDVCIGPLVAYRDPELGVLAPYAHSKNTPVWENITKLSESRKFKGRLILPPFVVIRRTSSPSDKNRASSAIINENSPVAVENHLIVVRPKTGDIEECKKLLRTLKSPETNDFINRRIRCRHLTVGVIKDIPLW